MAIDVFNIAAIVLMWAVVALGAFALLGDALVQRVKRCPKCWYDLSKTAANDAGHVTCSECGYEIACDRQFYRGRRRWGLVALAMLMLLGNYAVHVTPGVRERGWVAAVPTTALILAMPWIYPESSVSMWSQNPEAFTWREKLYVETSERFWSDVHWNWQERLLVHRCLRGDSQRAPLTEEWDRGYGDVLRTFISPYQPEPAWFDESLRLVELTVRSRAAWPERVPIHAEFSLKSWCEWDGVFRVVLHPRTHGMSRIEFVHDRVPRAGECWVIFPDYSWIGDVGVPATSVDRVFWDVEVWYSPKTADGFGSERLARQLSLELPLTIGGAVDDYMEKITDPEIDAILAGILAPAMHVLAEHYVENDWRDTLTLWNYEAMPEVPKSLAGITFGVEVELRRDGEPFRIGATWFAFHAEIEDDLSWVASSGDFEVWFEGEPITPEDVRPGRWEVVVRGRPELALRNVEARKAWVGEVRLPVQISTIE